MAVYMKLKLYHLILFYFLAISIRFIRSLNVIIGNSRLGMLKWKGGVEDRGTIGPHFILGSFLFPIRRSRRRKGFVMAMLLPFPTEAVSDREKAFAFSLSASLGLHFLPIMIPFIFLCLCLSAFFSFYPE